MQFKYFLKLEDYTAPAEECTYIRYQKNSMILEGTGREAPAEEMWVRHTKGQIP